VNRALNLWWLQPTAVPITALLQLGVGTKGHVVCNTDLRAMELQAVTWTDLQAGAVPGSGTASDISVHQSICPSQNM